MIVRTLLNKINDLPSVICEELFAADERVHDPLVRYGCG
jgi:hypothetical protein